MSILVALAVRYGFLLSMMMLNLVCSNMFSKFGVMSRYTQIKREDGVARSPLSKKIVFQVIFAFFGVYLLYALMAYSLSKLTT